MKKFFHKFYKKYIRNKIKGTLARQRLKFFLWDVYGYIPLLKTNVVSFRKKLLLLKKFVLVDWYVVHAHKPCELVPVILLILENANGSAYANAVVVEAGCWLGGSSAKLSQACAVSGRQLHIYDSFAGVEPGDPSNREAHFFGTYVGAEEIVRRNVERFGDMAVCTFHKGWFIESFKNYDMKTGIVYIDCDLTKATMEVITAVQPHLLDGGKIFTQDYHISSVREALHDTKTWEMLHILPPKIQKLERNTASLNWDHV